MSNTDDLPVDLPYTPDYGPAHRLGAPMRPAPNHPIWTLDVATLDYVIESLVGIWTVEPDLLIESAIADVRVIRGYAASTPVTQGLQPDASNPRVTAPKET